MTTLRQTTLFLLGTMALMAVHCGAPSDETSAEGVSSDGASRSDQLSAGPGECGPDFDSCQGDRHCVNNVCVRYGEGESSDACGAPTLPLTFAPEQACAWPPPGQFLADGWDNVYTTPLVLDFQYGDPNTREIALTTWKPVTGGRIGKLRLFDGCSELSSFPAIGDTVSLGNGLTGYIAYGTQIAAGDLDGDGKPELLAMVSTGTALNDTSRLGLMAIKVTATGMVEHWKGRRCGVAGAPALETFGNHQRNYGPGLYDIDPTLSGPEILVGDGLVFDRNGCLLNTLAANPEPATEGSLGVLNTVADLDRNGVMELVAGQRIASWNTTTRSWNDLPQAPGRIAMPGLVAVADMFFEASDPTGGLSIDAGRLAEVVVVSPGPPGSTANGTIRVDNPRSYGPGWSGQAIATQWGPFALHRAPGYTTNNRGGPPTIGDFDGDGQPEIGVAAGRSYAIYDPDCTPGYSATTFRQGGTCNRPPAPTAAGQATPGATGTPILWWQTTSDASSNATGSTLFDFNNDGEVEVIYRDEVNLHVWNGRTGAPLMPPRPAASFTGYEYPVVADVLGSLAQGPTATEVVVPRGSNGAPAINRPGGFEILRHVAGQPWAATRPAWNQHAYSITNVTDAGTVTSHPQLASSTPWTPNWTSPGLNNFRANVPLVSDAQALGDLTARFVSEPAEGEACESVGTRLVVLVGEVCNRGGRPVPGPIRTNFYTTNQTITNLTPMSPEWQLKSCGGSTAPLVINTTLAPGQCAQVTCETEVTPSDSDMMFQVDRPTSSQPGGSVNECLEGNNHDIVQCLGILLGPKVCGDGACQPGETATSCPADCHCGNGTCNPGQGETLYNCAADCRCGNGTCEPNRGETPGTCSADCGSCGNGTCEPKQGETMHNCPSDCTCGNRTCEPNKGETATSCPTDCRCGNGTCDPGETRTSCPSDCKGLVLSVCGDGVCQSKENALNCPEDCQSPECPIGQKDCLAPAY